MIHFVSRWRKGPDISVSFIGVDTGERGYEARLESVRHFWIRPEAERGEGRKLWQVPKAYVDRVMESLGVQIVWCKDYEHVRICLGELQKLGYDKQFGRAAWFETQLH